MSMAPPRLTADGHLLLLPPTNSSVVPAVSMITIEMTETFVDTVTLTIVNQPISTGSPANHPVYNTSLTLAQTVAFSTFVMTDEQTTTTATSAGPLTVTTSNFCFFSGEGNVIIPCSTTRIVYPHTKKSAAGRASRPFGFLGRVLRGLRRRR